MSSFMWHAKLWRKIIDSCETSVWNGGNSHDGRSLSGWTWLEDCLDRSCLRIGLRLDYHLLVRLWCDCPTGSLLSQRSSWIADWSYGWSRRATRATRCQGCKPISIRTQRVLRRSNEIPTIWSRRTLWRTLKLETQSLQKWTNPQRCVGDTFCGRTNKPGC